jgi:guanine deaminase
MVSVAIPEEGDHQEPSLSRQLRFFNLIDHAEKSFTRFQPPLILLASAQTEAAHNPRRSHAFSPNMNSPLMARAIQLAIENVRSGQGGPFGAVVAKDGEIIAEGANRVTLTNDPTAHAEVQAIRQACQKLSFFELKGCELYTSCEPCPMCLGAIYWSRLSRVYFGSLAADATHAGFDDSFIYREISQPHPERGIPMVQMMREEALAAFRAWQQKSDKIRY